MTPMSHHRANCPEKHIFNQISAERRKTTHQKNNCEPTRATPQQEMRAILSVQVDDLNQDLQTCMSISSGSQVPASPLKKSRFDEFYGFCASQTCTSTDSKAAWHHGQSSQRRRSVISGLVQQWEAFYGGSGFRN